MNGVKANRPELNGLRASLDLNETPTGVAIADCRYGKMMYLKGDIYVGRCLERYGEFSELEIAVLLAMVRPDDVVVDAGANVGALTLPLARKVGQRGRVLAFEPQSAVFNILCGNVALNELVQVETHRSALGDHGGTIELPQLGYRASVNYGGLSIASRADAIEKAPIIRLDDLGLTRLRLLKADVEGSENALIAGANETIKRCAPILWVENDRRDKSAELIARLQDLGYRLWWHVAPLFNPKNFRNDPVNIIGNYVSINLLGVPRSMPSQITGMREVSGPGDWWK